MQRNSIDQPFSTTLNYLPNDSIRADTITSLGRKPTVSANTFKACVLFGQHAGVSPCKSVMLSISRINFPGVVRGKCLRDDFSCSLLLLCDIRISLLPIACSEKLYQQLISPQGLKHALESCLVLNHSLRNDITCLFPTRSNCLVVLLHSRAHRRQNQIFIKKRQSMQHRLSKTGEPQFSAVFVPTLAIVRLLHNRVHIPSLSQCGNVLLHRGISSDAMAFHQSQYFWFCDVRWCLACFVLPIH
mmetsp:Transcript_86947/g.150451  ORF Transcript_86947/g.150451 Transcript_86947/m.150451 type:complete len:244 (+) Transcript_86947:408-1139(+)